MERTAVALGLVVLAVECLLAMAPAVGGDQTKYQLVYPRIFAEAHALVPTPWSFWGYMQYLVNMLFTAAFVLRGDVLARLINVAFGVLATLAVFSLGRRALRACGRHLGGDPLLHHAVHRHADDPGVGGVRAGALRPLAR